MASVITAGVGTTRRAAVQEHGQARWPRVTLTWAGALLAAGTGWVIAAAAQPTAVDPELTLLIRGMAGIKALMVTVLLAALTWRTRWRLSTPLWVAYVTGAWSMAFATMLIWHYAFIGPAAIFFHAAELTLLVLAWRDGRGNFSLLDYPGRRLHR